MTKKATRRARRAKAAKVANLQTDEATSTLLTSAWAAQSTDQKAMEFVEDYYYVYSDIRFLIVITVLMLLLMFGLSFVL